MARHSGSQLWRGTLYSNQRMVEVFLYCTRCFLLSNVPHYHLEGDPIYRFILFTF